MKNKVQILISALSLAAVVIIMAAPASAIDFAISGHLNRAALYADDGESAKWFFVDNSNSTSRFRFRGSNDFENGWKAGLLWEVQMQSNPASKMSMDEDGDTADVTFTERHLEVWIEKWGRLRLGQGDTAGNGTSEVDLSGTDVAHYSSLDDIGGNFEFRDGDKKLDITVSQSRSNYDGFSRKDRVRYDTPRWAGFFASASVENQSQWDMAGRYAGDFGWARFAAAAAYSDYGTSDDDNDWLFSSSASMLFDFGLSLTASYSRQDRTNKNPWNLFGKIGYKFLEKHAASVVFARTKHRSADDDEGDTFSLAYVFTPWDSVELYGSYFMYMLDRDRGTTPDDINIGLVGARFRF